MPKKKQTTTKPKAPTKAQFFKTLKKVARKTN